MVLATQKGVDVSFSSLDRTMSLDDYSERVLAPAINNLAGAIAADVMSGTEGGVCNLVQNNDGSGNIISPNASTYLNAGASLNTNSAPLGERKVVNDPFTEARVVASLSGLFNPVADVSRQYKTGMMQQALGFDWLMDQTVIKHTSGSFTAGTVNTGSQTGSTIITNAITGTLAQGDIITFANVNAVNRITKVSTGQLRQFVLTAPAASGATSLSIYPAIVPAVAGNAVQYQTTDTSPINGATITLVTKPSVTYRKNIVYAPLQVRALMARVMNDNGVNSGELLAA